MVTPSIGTRDLTKLLNILLDTDTPVFIHGSPGIGKSYITAEMAKARGWELIDIRLSQLDPVDLRGIPVIKGETTKWMPPVFFPQDEKSRGILFLDELNSAPPTVQSAIYQLILDRAVGEYTLPKGWRIVSAGNRVNDKGIVFRLPSPLSNRMVHLVLEANFEDFKIWAIENNLHSFIIGFLSFRPDLLSQEVPRDSETNPAFATPRSWTMVSTILKNVGKVAGIEPLVYGAIGYAAGVEFLSYVEVYKELPDVNAILRGESVEVPKNPSILYALCATLLERFSLEHAGAVFAFSKSLPVEFAVMLIKDIFVKEEGIAELPAFDEWVEQYGNIIV